MSRNLLRAALLAVVLAAGAGAPAFAFDETSPAVVNVDASGLALRGHDPVAYVTVGAPTLGDPAFTATHGGAVYRFASAGNRDAFLADPERYAPAYGGFCAMGAAYGRKFDGDPALWRIVDGRLYVQVHQGAMNRWLEDVPGNVARADSNWPEIRGKAPKDLE